MFRKTKRCQLTIDLKPLISYVKGKHFENRKFLQGKIFSGNSSFD